MTRRLIRIALGMLVGLMLTTRVDAAPIVYLSHSVGTPSGGSVLALDVLGVGFEDLYTFQFDVIFNPSILQATDTIEGSFLSNYDATFFIPGAIDNDRGLISFTANTLLGPTPGASGGGTLATILFDVAAAGTAGVVLHNVLLFDSMFDIMEPDIVGGISVSVSPSVPDPTPVPEPASLVLLSTAFAALGASRWRRRTGRARG